MEFSNQCEKKEQVLDSRRKAFNLLFDYRNKKKSLNGLTNSGSIPLRLLSKARVS